MAVTQFHPGSDAAIRFLLGNIGRENFSAIALLALSHVLEYEGIKNRQNDGQNGTKGSCIRMGNQIRRGRRDTHKTRFIMVVLWNFGAFLEGYNHVLKIPPEPVATKPMAILVARR